MQCFERTVENLQVRMRPLQDLREGGGAGRTMTPEPIALGGPWASRGPAEGPWDSEDPLK